MTLEKLHADMVKAMKEKDKVRKNVVSSLIAAVKKYGIDNGVRDNIPENMVDSVILKEMKTVKEQIDTCPKDRTDLLEEYGANYEIIKEYAPSLMGAEEIEKLLVEKYAELIATKNKGMIMKTVMQELKGKADGKVINEVVAKLCG